MRIDNLTGTGLPSSAKRGISSPERRGVGDSTEPTRKDDSSRPAPIATLGVSMLTTGIPLPRSAQTRSAQSLVSGHRSNPCNKASQLVVTQPHVAACPPGDPYKVARL